MGDLGLAQYTLLVQIAFSCYEKNWTHGYPLSKKYEVSDWYLYDCIHALSSIREYIYKVNYIATNFFGVLSNPYQVNHIDSIAKHSQKWSL